MVNQIVMQELKKLELRRREGGVFDIVLSSSHSEATLEKIQKILDKDLKLDPYENYYGISDYFTKYKNNIKSWVYDKVQILFAARY